MEERASKLVAMGYNMDKLDPPSNAWMDRVVIANGLAFVSGHTWGKGKVTAELSQADAKRRPRARWPTCCDRCAMR